ncbi:hypothetical protein [Cellulomonas soli]|nr:hypothetical protein [Cellulomonas soli]NYI58933.1 hypothetical protein [Cellulomonas soli]
MVNPQPVAVRKTSLTGPVWLTVSGAVLILIALAIGAGTAVLLFRTAGSGVLTFSGEPGSSVIAEVDAPGTTTVDLVAGERYAVHLVEPATAGGLGDLVGDVHLLAPSGETVVADGTPGVDSTSTMGDVTARSVAAFTAPEDGTYVLAVPSADVDHARVLLAPDQAFAPFFAGIFGSILGVFAAVLIGLLGTGMAVGGGIWWGFRVRARRAVNGVEDRAGS